jgi:hypothetical protein
MQLDARLYANYCSLEGVKLQKEEWVSPVIEEVGQVSDAMKASIP